MKLDSLEKLFVHELKDLHSAEKQMLEALPKMEEAASAGSLKKAFRDHRGETEGHLRRLDSIFEGLEFEPGGHKCKAMAGLIEEGADMIAAEADEAVRDAGLIAAAQRVEHYEIAAYGTARALAERLGNQQAADLLRETLEEEGRADRDLSQLASRSINFVAQVANGDS
ncbi:MAG: ferritin-like metal-binding protein YciE [Verrucomicrobiales bacterium]|jgi:ferritin-like metal-binding protein YciE